MKPVIGITTESTGDKLQLNQSYVNAISDLGGVPLLLAKTDELDVIEEQVHRIDGLYLTGGSDINPATYDEEPHENLGKVEHGRDEYEIQVIKHAIKKKIPILGVCRGNQLLNSLNGGTMYQDLPSQKEGELIQHKQQSGRDFLQHTIEINQESKLYRIIQQDKIRVNSHHHQANKDIADEFRIAATAPDGVIEAIESKDEDHFILALQFHPEDAYTLDDSAKKILEAFIDAAVEYDKTVDND